MLDDDDDDGGGGDDDDDDDDPYKHIHWNGCNYFITRMI